MVVPAEGVDDVESLRTTTNRDEEGIFQVTTLAPVLLDAIAMEKSGFRGMRLLVERDLLSRSDRFELREWLGCEPLIPVRRLSYSAYPPRMDTYEDILWMGTCNDDEIVQWRRRMGTRMRFVARDAEEMQHAAATSVVFDECAEILAHASQPRSRGPMAKKATGRRDRR